MKNTILCCVFVLALITSLGYSQNFPTDKGAVLFSGTGSFSSQGGDLFEEDGDRLTQLTLAPSVNSFVSRNVFIGGALTFSRMSVGSDSYTTIGIGPTVGFAIGNEQSKNYPYFGGGISYYSLGDEDDTTSGTDIKLGGGIIFDVRDHLGIVVEVGYHIMNLKHKDWDESKSGNIFAIGVGLAGLLY